MYELQEHVHVRVHLYVHVHEKYEHSIHVVSHSMVVFPTVYISISPQYIAEFPTVYSRVSFIVLHGFLLYMYCIAELYKYTYVPEWYTLHILQSCILYI
jgi:hypothetical protein